MPERTQQKSANTIGFSDFARCVIQGRFEGASITMDTGVDAAQRDRAQTGVEPGGGTPHTRSAQPMIHHPRSARLAYL